LHEGNVLLVAVAERQEGALEIFGFLTFAVVDEGIAAPLIVESA
jgi:hypothetical protein